MHAARRSACMLHDAAHACCTTQHMHAARRSACMLRRVGTQGVPDARWLQRHTAMQVVQAGQHWLRVGHWLQVGRSQRRLAGRPAALLRALCAARWLSCCQRRCERFPWSGSTGAHTWRRLASLRQRQEARKAVRRQVQPWHASRQLSAMHGRCLWRMLRHRRRLLHLHASGGAHGRRCQQWPRFRPRECTMHALSGDRFPTRPSAGYYRTTMILQWCWSMRRCGDASQVTVTSHRRPRPLRLTFPQKCSLRPCAQTVVPPLRPRQRQMMQRSATWHLRCVWAVMQPRAHVRHA
jgi:hypothetical protein